MKKLYYRIVNAFKLFWLAFMNPEYIRESHFKMSFTLLEMIMKVMNEGKPYMSRIGFIHPDEGNKPIVSIWAGPGMGADPLIRIEELLEENAKLRETVLNNIK